MVGTRLALKTLQNSSRKLKKNEKKRKLQATATQLRDTCSVSILGF